MFPLPVYCVQCTAQCHASPNSLAMVKVTSEKSLDQNPTGFGFFTSHNHFQLASAALHVIVLAFKKLVALSPALVLLIDLFLLYYYV